MQQDTETLTYTSDTWSSRTSQFLPSSQKLKVSAVIRDRYYMKVTNTVKIDNVQELTINQAFNFTVGAKLRLNNTSGSFINSGYILSVDKTNNKVFLAVNNNEWSNDLNTGLLVTEQFAEQSTYGITGPVPDDTNVIENYSFNLINNTTPGTFDIDLDDYNVDGTFNAGGGQDLDGFAKFKPFDVNSYAVKIEEVAGGSTYIVGSVVQISSSNISFNSSYSTAQITGLTGVLKITLVSTLDKILQVTAVANTNEVYAITADRHYLSAGENINVDGNPSQESGGVTYDEYDGSFVVDRVVSTKEFVYKLKTTAITAPATNAGNVNIFVKSPVLKMYYGHQYLFDLSHSSLVGSNLSFSKDNLFKLEYSFNSIERIGVCRRNWSRTTHLLLNLKLTEMLLQIFHTTLILLELVQIHLSHLEVILILSILLMSAHLLLPLQLVELLQLVIISLNSFLQMNQRILQQFLVHLIAHLHLRQLVLFQTLESSTLAVSILDYQS